MNNFAFIDSQNLNLSIRGQGWILDFKRFKKYLEDKYSVTQKEPGDTLVHIVHLFDGAETGSSLPILQTRALWMPPPKTDKGSAAKN